jgi:hypothetical protein
MRILSILFITLFTFPAMAQFQLEMPAILDEKERSIIVDRLLEERFKTVLLHLVY